jgi:hypothetical protein
VPLSEPVLSQFTNLRQTLEASRLVTREKNAYYEGEHYLEQLGLAIPPDLRRFSVFLDWPRTVVDALEMRLDVTGFRMPGKPADQSLWEVWQYNNLINGADPRAHRRARAVAARMLCVGTNGADKEFPLVTVESPMEMIAVRDPRTRAVTAALRLYGGSDSSVYPAAGLSDQRSTTGRPCTCRTRPAG